MEMQVITVRREKGIGKKSNQPYDFQIIGALTQTEKGIEMCEFALDGDKPTPDSGKRYTAQMSVYVDREKKLQFRIATLVPVVPVKAA